mmetsp:Transcript_86710/g.232594  ORF Transcript_86710/g.232594 Transcript_86710/m.232594 type:complete len:436 (-) Transcript_86710:168-1475(-)
MTGATVDPQASAARERRADEGKKVAFGEADKDKKAGDKERRWRMPSRYQVAEKLGQGSYGCVCEAHDAERGGRVAIKRTDHLFDDAMDARRTLREVAILSLLRHDNVVRLLDVFAPGDGLSDFNELYVVMELCDSDLKKLCRSATWLSALHLRRMLWTLLCGLKYVHSAGIYHRDLKPANCLVNQGCDVKICDFGLARVLQSQEQDTLGRTDYVVTRWYRAPEVVLLASEYTVSIDVWAVGCILCELVARKPAFAGKDHLDQIRKIVGVLGTPAEEELSWLPESGPARSFLKKCPCAPKAQWPVILPSASSAAVEAIEAMLCFDPAARVTVQDAMRLRYFDSLFEEEDLEHDIRGSTADWEFDDFKPTKPLLQSLIYCECASFHPEIVERDQDLLASRGIDQLLLKEQERRAARGGEAAAPPRQQLDLPSAGPGH